MSEQLPEQIDPFRLVRQRRILSGSLSVSHMERLVPLLCSPDAQAHVVMEFGTDDMGIQFVRGQVTSELMLTCQRCGQPVLQVVNAEYALGLVADRDAADRLPPHYEPLIVEHVPTPLRTIVEDELLLALPIVAMHPEGECTMREPTSGDEDAEPRRENPFAVLSQLKPRKRGKKS